MHITYLHQYFNTPSMSGGTRSFEMARRLAESGHVVNMITSWRAGDGRTDWFTTEESGVCVHWLPVPYSNHMSYAERIRAFFRFAFHAARRAGSIEADLVFATSTPLTIALPAIYAAGRQRAPMVFEVRDLWPELPIAMGAIRHPMVKGAARALERWAYRNSEAVVALSPGMRDGVMKTGFPAERIAVIPNGSDTEIFGGRTAEGEYFRASRPWLGKRPLLLYPGTFGKVNGVGYLVDLAKSLKKKGSEVRILLIGDGAEKQAVLKYARSAGVLGDNLFVEDALPKSEMPSLFAAANVIVSLCIDLPELRANSANKFFDALAAGKPCMLNYGGWQAELVNSNDAGLVTWGLTVDDAADLVASHISDSNWVSRTGLNAQKLAITYFDRNILADQFIAVLDRASSRNGVASLGIAPGVYPPLENAT